MIIIILFLYVGFVLEHQIQRFQIMSTKIDSIDRNRIKMH